mgnify:CR=1 FL=1
MLLGQFAHQLALVSLFLLLLYLLSVLTSRVNHLVFPPCLVRFESRFAYSFEFLGDEWFVRTFGQSLFDFAQGGFGSSTAFRVGN